EGHALGETPEQALGGVSAVAAEDKAAAREPGLHLQEHLPGQVYATGLTFARQAQARQQRQAEDVAGAQGDGDGQAEDHPVIATSRRHALLGGSDSIAEPAQTPDLFAALVQERVIDDEVEVADRVKAGNDE